MIEDVTKLTVEKDFLDLLQIMIKVKSFTTYLDLHRLPNLLEGTITTKFEVL